MRSSADGRRTTIVATEVSAIPELIRAERSGLLVPPEDPAALAAALDRLIRDPGLRATLGSAGTRRVREAFDLDHCVGDLAARFGLAAPQVEAPTEADILCASPSTRR